MRLLPLALGVALGVLTASARADIAPPPTCEAGKHHEYLYGHRCVPDGYHLAESPSGGVVTVKDGEEPKEILEKPPAPSASTTKPSTSVTAPAPSTPTPVATSTPTATSVAVPNPPPAKKGGCVYGDSAGADDGAMLGTIAAAAALSVARRRRIKTARIRA